MESAPGGQMGLPETCPSGRSSEGLSISLFISDARTSRPPSGLALSGRLHTVATQEYSSGVYKSLEVCERLPCGHVKSLHANCCTVGILQ